MEALGSTLNLVQEVLPKALPTIIGVILGSVLTLLSARITKYWENREKQIKIASYIRRLVEYELFYTEHESENLCNYMGKTSIPDLKYDHVFYTSEHNSILLSSVATDAVCLGIEVLKAYATYFNLLKQYESFRMNLKEILNTEECNVEHMREFLAAHINRLERVKMASRSLIKLIEKYYPDQQ
jgi:hypothetical protein